jgi:hypothetical protein
LDEGIFKTKKFHNELKYKLKMNAACLPDAEMMRRKELSSPDDASLATA